MLTSTKISLECCLLWLFLFRFLIKSILPFSAVVCNLSIAFSFLHFQLFRICYSKCNKGSYSDKKSHHQGDCNKDNSNHWRIPIKKLQTITYDITNPTTNPRFNEILDGFISHLLSVLLSPRDINIIFNFNRRIKFLWY